MDITIQRKSAKDFAEYWKNRGYEKGESQRFWIGLLQNVYDVNDATQYISFEDKVQLDKTSFIDAYIEKTHVMIEQKSSNKNLDKGIKQSDGSFLTPFQQAQRYSASLPYSKRPRWIITCNFKEFRVYDMEKPTGSPEIILLSNLPKEYYRLKFLTDEIDINVKKEEVVSVQAGELVSKIYNELLKQYKNPSNPNSLRSINQLCVRLVFCLYAEDAGIFGRLGIFRDFLKNIDPSLIRERLISLFKVLNTKIKDRDPYLDDKLAEFPYVNGGMFSNEDIEIPSFTSELKELIVNEASDGFDWSVISPTIFGAVFESTLNPEARRAGGMHYTSIENIHKVIDPLFLDNLKLEFNQIKDLKQPATVKKRAKILQMKLANLKFLDPACGSGNFLTETYISLRKIENELIKLVHGKQSLLDTDQDLIKVSIQQFYGIEVNDFAVAVAKTALWIAESQMMEETKAIIYSDQDFLPLKTYTNIAEGNALTMDWNNVINAKELAYIMGNPPFIGHQYRTEAQNRDMSLVFYDLKQHGKLDYVCAWYAKAANYMKNTKINAAFVATNSIVQGESVSNLWSFLLSKKNVEIQFGYRNFLWNNEAKNKATVYVVIIGFTCYKTYQDKIIFNSGRIKKTKHINGYLVNSKDVYIKSRRKTPLNDSFPIMTKGSQPTDNGNLILDEKEAHELIKKYPITKNFIHLYLGSKEIIHNKQRYCLWLNDVSPSDYTNIKPIMDRLKNIKLTRSKSKTKSVKEAAQSPAIFTQIRQPKEDFIAIPEVSGEARKYIPITFLDHQIIASNKLYILPTNDLYFFGILTSNVHMGWMRTVSGRLNMRYSYSPAVYSNFPFPNISEKQIDYIRSTAQGILNARNLYPNNSLADLYNELAMPSELRKAHQANDKAVMEAYDMPIKGTTEADAVAKLFDLYEKIVITSQN